MGKSLYTLVSLVFFLQVQTVDISEKSLKSTSLEKLMDIMTDEGDLVCFNYE